MHDNERVLILDDDPGIRGLLARYLKAVGIESEPASCEEEAVERFSRGDISCVLIDLKIGNDQFAGLDSIPKFRGMDSTVPLIIVTAFPQAAEDHPDVEVVLKGADGIDAREFILKVKKALRDRCRDIKVNETHITTREIKSMLEAHITECTTDRRRWAETEVLAKAAVEAAATAGRRTIGEMLGHYSKDVFFWLLLVSCGGMLTAKWVELNEMSRAIRALEKRVP